MSEISNAIDWINTNILWGIPMVVIIIGTGIFLTTKAGFIQVRKFKDSLKTTIIPTIKNIFKGDKKKKTGKNSGISQFEAFSAAISGTVGTGNIVGVAGAMISGGPGAVFWMWVSAFFGMFTNYSENVLGLYFRKKDEDGGFSGGPMYYLEHGTKSKLLAKIFAFCCTFTAIGMTMVQTNSISETIQNLSDKESSKPVIALITGIVVASFTALIIMGGIKKIGRVASMIVPFMALLFIILAFVIIGANITSVPGAFLLIFESAFSTKAVGGGLLGVMIMRGMRFGCARGVFSNEAGLGSSVIAHSASETREPVQQGLWGIFGVFFDTFVICTITAISIICTSEYDFTDIIGNAAAGLNKNAVASHAMGETFGLFGTVMYSIILPLFAFTTVLAWSYYGEKAVEYLFGSRSGKIKIIYKVIYVLLIVVGAVITSDLVWSLDDMFNAAMAIPNLIGLISLSGLICKITKNYYDRKSGLNIEPMLSAYPEMNEEFKKDIARMKSENKN